MRFKTDENLPLQAAERLRTAGYDALSVLEQAMGGEADRTLAAICQQEARILLTLDLDFADIRAYPPAEYPGLVVLRLSRQDKASVLAMLERLLTAFEQETPERRLWVVEEQRIRVRE